jgi:hypothetical protein
MPGRATLLQGTLDLLILKALSAGELHGLGVSRRIEQLTRGTFVVQPGSLPRPAPSRGGWLVDVCLAAFRKQPSRQVLRTQPGGTRTVGAGNGAMEPDCPRDGSCAGSMTPGKREETECAGNVSLQ